MRKFLLPIALVLSLSACALFHAPDASLASKVVTACQDMVWSIEQAESVQWLPTDLAITLVNALTDVEVIVSATPQGAQQTALVAVQRLEIDWAGSRALPYLVGLEATLKAL